MFFHWYFFAQGSESHIYFKFCLGCEHFKCFNERTALNYVIVSIKCVVGIYIYIYICMCKGVKVSKKQHLMSSCVKSHDVCLSVPRRLPTDMCGCLGYDASALHSLSLLMMNFVMVNKRQELLTWFRMRVWLSQRSR